MSNESWYKRQYAEDLALALVETEDTDLTYDDVKEMSSRELYDWLEEAWGYEWDGESWCAPDGA